MQFNSINYKLFHFFYLTLMKCDMKKIMEGKTPENFAKDCGLEIPDQFLKDPKLKCNGDNFYSTDTEFCDFYDIDQILQEDLRNFPRRSLLENNPYFLAFGFDGHGFNSYTFRIIYANKKMHYNYKIDHGGSFESEDSKIKSKKAIKESFLLLSNILNSDQIEDNSLYFINVFGYRIFGTKFTFVSGKDPECSELDDSDIRKICIDNSQ